jgi:hypothetical protein
MSKHTLLGIRAMQIRSIFRYVTTLAIMIKLKLSHCSFVQLDFHHTRKPLKPLLSKISRIYLFWGAVFASLIASAGSHGRNFAEKLDINSPTAIIHHSH